jgi:hypothetical protein
MQEINIEFLLPFSTIFSTIKDIKNTKNIQKRWKKHLLPFPWSLKKHNPEAENQNCLKRNNKNWSFFGWKLEEVKIERTQEAPPQNWMTKQERESFRKRFINRWPEPPVTFDYYFLLSVISMSKSCRAIKFLYK